MSNFQLENLFKNIPIEKYYYYNLNKEHVDSFNCKTNIEFYILKISQSNVPNDNHYAIIFDFEKHIHEKSTYILKIDVVIINNNVLLKFSDSNTTAYWDPKKDQNIYRCKSTLKYIIKIAKETKNNFGDYNMLFNNCGDYVKKFIGNLRSDNRVVFEC